MYPVAIAFVKPALRSFHTGSGAARRRIRCERTFSLRIEMLSAATKIIVG